MCLSFGCLSLVDLRVELFSEVGADRKPTTAAFTARPRQRTQRGKVGDSILVGDTSSPSILA
jgi:hypothetical protein